MRKVFSRVYRAGLFTCMNLILLALPAYALYTAQGESYSIDTGGSIRTIGSVVKNYDDPLLFGRDNIYDSSSQALLRLTSTGSLPHESVFEIHVVGEVFSASTNQAGIVSDTSATSPLPSRYRLTRGAWEVARDDDLRTSIDTDRLNIKFSYSGMDIILGRQAINFSQAYFWNPLDVFLAFDPQAFDRDYKPGIDALRLDFALGNFSCLTIAAAPGRELKIEYTPGEADISAGSINAYGSAFMARYTSTIDEWDLALQTGALYGGYQAGAGFSGEIHKMGFRGEAAYVKAQGHSTTLVPDPYTAGFVQAIDIVEDHFALVLGTDYRFENSLYFNLEYLYNSQGQDDNLNEAFVRRYIGETLSMGKHLAGLQLTYEFHPLLTGQAVWIYSFSDASSLVSPTITYSLADEAEFLCGATLGDGDRPSSQQVVPGLNIPVIESEYGTYPDVFFMEFKFYF